MNLSTPQPRSTESEDAARDASRALSALPAVPSPAASNDERLQTSIVPALLSPYLSEREYRGLRALVENSDSAEGRTYFEGLDPLPPQNAPARPGLHYGDNLFQEVANYAERVLQTTRNAPAPDVVHAHDWMTFPAAIALAKRYRVPLVLHVHSLERDRSPHDGNPNILAIEGEALRAATRVIAVSHYTARMVHERYGVPLHSIDVVHNGVRVRSDEPQPEAASDEALSDEALAPEENAPTVLFLGRITYQKGPEYFVEAAAKVLSEVPNARFIMAGSGDMQPHVAERVRELGIEDAFTFPGFVTGLEVEQLFSRADVYVMPSVSEPFGISALEAMSHDTPVILSRQSGASELLKHALKVDFWDVHKLAAHIIAVLRYPELSRSLTAMAREEVRRVHWEASAEKVLSVYHKALQES